MVQEALVSRLLPGPKLVLQLFVAGTSVHENAILKITKVLTTKHDRLSRIVTNRS